ncbi:MAG: HAMP domain-containing histidine kinase [candidate division KSB1 bacterium]|nr:HAMP domain-containing histidine kinase [candidate division KSB1 bacterium]MDZ7303034.1 HAMP domain-containing histidine kinase [candidate division KSB1 bacterium]MDZ7312458.1 HAMP domain-containing histidine kinase [candidate division KSB1 bacterium]
MFYSFRLKIVFWHSLLVLITLLLFRLVSVEVIRSSLYEDFDNSLRAEAEWVRGILEAYKTRNIPDEDIKSDIDARSSLSPRKELIEIYQADGTEYFRSPQLESERLRTLGQSHFLEPLTVREFRGRHLRLFGVKDDLYEIYVGYPLTDIEAAIHEILSSSLFLIPVTLLFVVISGIFLVVRFVQPIKELNRYAEKLLHQPLDRELPKITARTKDEIGELIERINEVIEKMRNSMRQVLSFSSLASHELRTPLTIVRNQVEEAMHSEMPAEELRRNLASIYDEILRMKRIVDDLLSLSTMQAGTFKIKPERVALHTMLNEFYEEACLLARDKNITVLITPVPQVFIQADGMRIRQVLFNLLDNALKHTPENGCIRLNCDLQDGQALLQFADTGSGIPPQVLSKIFDPFYRRTMDGFSSHGAGLGLALVKWIVEAHRGSITVESELGKGTTFLITLPVDTDVIPAS